MNNLQSKKIQWGIIGCGDVTEIKSGPPYYTVDGFSLHAVMRRDEEKAKDYAKRHHVKKYYTNADDLINDPDIDAVYIATPPNTHKLYGLKVAAAKKICCIEKPLAPNYNDCQQLVEAFKANNIPLFVAYYRRTLPRFVQVKKWIEAEEIGTIRHINWQLSKETSQQDLSLQYNWRTDNVVATGGYFDDLASHGLNLFEFYFGAIKEAKGISLNQQSLYTAYDAVTACWVHQNGITGAGSWNFGSHKDTDTVTIYGSNGTIEFSVFDDAEIQLTTKNKHIALKIEHPKNVQFYHVQAMRNFLMNGEEHPSMGDSGMQTSWVLDTILGKI